MKQIEQYKKILETGNKSEHTIRAYVKDLTKLADHFHISDASELENVTVEQYHDFYAKQGLSENSIKAMIRNLSAFFTWLVDNEIVSKDNSFSRVKFGKGKFPKVIQKKKAILTMEEAVAVINAGRNLQEKFMLSLMMKTALRRDEICNIKISDIKGCAISLKSKGGNEDNETYLDEELCGMLNEYMLERKTDSPYLFYGTRGFDGNNGKLTGTSVNNRVKACVALAGVPEEKAKLITAHRLRAFSITQMVIKNGIFAGQMLGRHKSIETTKLYVNTGNEYVKKLLLGDK